MQSGRADDKTVPPTASTHKRVRLLCSSKAYPIRSNNTPCHTMHVFAWQ